MKNIIIVTGASSGLGKEFAIQIAQSFVADELWLIARRKENLENLCIEINNNKTNMVAKAIPLNISGLEGVKQFVAILENEKKVNDFNISLLINNAGFGTYGPFEKTDIERELEMIELNCTALTGICGYSLKFMERNSIIINTASVASFLPLGNFAVYGATKSYVLNFTLALAAEVKHKGIKVCALCPGPVSTEFSNVASNGARKEVKHGKSPRKVVSHCLKKAKKGKHVAIMTLKWKLTAFMSRFVGRYTTAFITYTFFKRPYK